MSSFLTLSNINWQERAFKYCRAILDLLLSHRKHPPSDFNADSSFLPLADNFQHLICQSLHSTQLVDRKAFRKRSFMSKRKQGDQWSNGTKWAAAGVGSVLCRQTGSWGWALLNCKGHCFVPLERFPPDLSRGPYVSHSVNRGGAFPALAGET